MNIRTEQRPGALVTYPVRVRRFDSRRGFAAGASSYCPVFWSASLQDGENALPFDRRFHSLCAERKLRSVWHRATRCMAQSHALRRSLDELLDKMCTEVKQRYVLFRLEPELIILYSLFILMTNVYVCHVVIRHEGVSHYLHCRTLWLNLFYLKKKKNPLFISVPQELFCHTFRHLKKA